MTAKSILGGIAPGAPTPAPGACGWDEQFDEASLAALMAKYPHGFFGNSWNYNLAPGADSDYLELSGGRLLIHGLGNGYSYGLVLDPGYLPMPRSLWYRIECEMIGGAYDADVEADPRLFDINTHTAETGPSAGIYAWGLTGAPLTANPIDSPPRSGNVWVLEGNAPPASNVDSSLSDTMTVGSHTIVLFMSTSASCEFWYDAAPGDAVIASATFPAYPAGFRFHQTQILGPAGAGKTLAIGRIQLVCGSRSSDPFGIL